MKTTLSFIIALLITGTLISWQSGPVSDPGSFGSERITIANILPVESNKATVNYQVEVGMTADIEPCGTYLVEMINWHGNLVAPAQLWIPGKDKYFFTEQTHAGMDFRIARLVRVLPVGKEEFCPTSLKAVPDLKNLNLSDGDTYFFKLSVGESSSY
jgi:hypothetical protein